MYHCNAVFPRDERVENKGARKFKRGLEKKSTISKTVYVCINHSTFHT